MMNSPYLNLPLRSLEDAQAARKTPHHVKLQDEDNNTRGPDSANSQTPRAAEQSPIPGNE
jgi:hypothetical protein